MSALLHLSDPHFGTEVPAVVEALLKFCARLKPRVVVVSGDITQRARRDQFRAAREFLTRLNVLQTLLLPGNHDIPLFALSARLIDPYRAFAREFGRELERVIDTPEFLVIGVNTTRWYRHIQGEVSDTQIEQVSERLRLGKPEQLKLVVTHQPVWIPPTENPDNRLRGADRAIAQWRSAGADAILGGHIHLPLVEPLGAALHAVQAGTAISSRTRAGIPNSVNVIHPNPARVERWDYLDGGFQRVAETALRAR
jgi:3',5'-cyclic AMP phosphodiesterase CpdA